MIDPAIAPLIDDTKARLASAFAVGHGPLEESLCALQGEVSATMASQLAVLASAETGDVQNLDQVQIAHARLVRLLKRGQHVPVSAARRQAQLILLGKFLVAVVLVNIAARLV